MKTLPTAVALTLTLSLAARADAPPDQYATFMPDDAVIHDAFTGLTWTRAPVKTNRSATDYPLAVSDCEGLKLAKAPKARWRLPTVRELLTIVDELPHLEYDPKLTTNTYRAIDANAFPSTPSGRFFAMSPKGANEVWFVDFSGGSAGVDVTGTALYAVRCVAY